MTGESMEKVRDVIVDCFDESDFAMFLRIRFDIRLKAAIPGDTFTIVVFNTVQKAEKEGWLPELLSAAAVERPKRADLQELSAEFAIDSQAVGKTTTSLTRGAHLDKIRRQQELLEVLKLHDSQLSKRHYWEKSNPYFQKSVIPSTLAVAAVGYLLGGLVTIGIWQIVGEVIHRRFTDQFLDEVASVAGLVWATLGVVLIYCRSVRRAMRERMGDGTPLARLTREFPDFIAEWEAHNLTDSRSLPLIIRTEEAVLARLATVKE